MALLKTRVEVAFLSKGASVTMKQTSHPVISKMWIETLSIDKMYLWQPVMFFNTNLNTENVII